MKAVAIRLPKKYMNKASKYNSEHRRFQSSMTLLVYDRNHYFGLGPKPKPKLAATYIRYSN